jgi:carboxypeptidase family protein
MLRIGVLLLALAAAALPAHAQVQAGSIVGVIHDQQGAVLPGVGVTLTGPAPTQEFVSEGDGRYRFLNLPPGTYTVTTNLAGFTSVRREGIVLTVGQTVEIPIQMRVAAVQETVTVTGESPVVDTRQMGTGTTFTQDELLLVPNSRDPWALLRTVPGVMMDRVNIAGNETGQQSEFVGKGATRYQSTWTLDGVVITDMAATGASPTYFDYDAFDEIRISTGGQDIRQPTGGVGLNFIVKRGTNDFRGGVKGFFTNDSFEASNLHPELAQRGLTAATADHNEEISEYGGDLGGPIVRDRLFFWGSVVRQDIRLFRLATRGTDRTVLDTTNLKLNWQATRNDMINFLWFNGAKKKFGRQTGNAQIEAATATWRQDNNYPDNPFHGLWKAEDNRVMTPNLFLSGRYAYYGTGFLLEPMGGTELQSGISTLLGQTFGSTVAQYFLRPQHSANLEATWFVGGAHDVKFGGGWRRSDSTTQAFWPGDMAVGYENSASDFRARLNREGLGTNRMQYFHLYLDDTVATGPATFDLGLRWDRQWGSALPAQTRSNLAFPSVVPGIQFPGYDTPFTWNTFSPRAGLTYALDEARRTIVRASVSMFAGQLDSAVVGYINPSANIGYAEYPWVDLDGDHLVQPGEVEITPAPLTFGGGFNPASPTAVISANRIDPDLKSNKSLGLVIGGERELAPNLALQANYTFGRSWDHTTSAGGFLYTPWVGLTLADYEPGAVTPEGVQLFTPNAALVAANGNARILTNYPGYVTRYHGVEISLHKRMSNNWMMRLGTSFNNATEHYDERVNALGNPTPRDTEPLVSGGQFAQRSAGSGQGDIFINGRWNFNVNGAYRLPAGFQAAGNLFGRQGNPFPHFRQLALGLDGSNRILVSPTLDAERFENLWNLDLRLSKDFRWNPVAAQIHADLFNVFNANTELQRERNMASPNFRRLNQTLSPRILRIGVRVGF